MFSSGSNININSIKYTHSKVLRQPAYRIVGRHLGCFPPASFLRFVSNLRANSFRTVPPETYFSQYFCASRLATVLFPQAVIPAKQITLFFLRACLAVMD
jgi:hypothetical protein